MSGRDGGGEVADVWVYSGAAGVAVGTFMLYVLVGACFSYFPRPKGLITREMVSNLSALLMQLLVPCMLLSALGQNLDAATLGQSAGLVVWATVNLLISFVIAYFVLPRCVRVPQHLFVPFVLALTFNNSGSMPIVLLEPLARSPALAADPDAYDRALAYIWVYGLVWQVMLWGFGAPAAEEVLTSPPVLGIAGGSCLGLVRPAGDALFSPAGSLAPVGSVISTLGAAMVGSSNLVLAGSLYHGSVDTLARLRRRGKLPCAARPCQAQAPPPMQRAAASGELAPRSAPSQKEGGGSAAPGHSRSGVFGSGEPATPSRGSLSLEVPEPAGEEGLSATAMALVLAVRLVIAPAVSFGLYAAAMALKVPLLVPPGGSMASPEAAAAGTDPIIFVVALVQACTPSAQFALVITQQAGLSRAAESLSLLYLVMYPLSLLTMPAWITLALSLVFGNA
ncbi:hypothetical protein FNF31_05030 [Cafeteria roenbergensis]|uniref:Auxin efflux carrier n=1 Tax=Cafeteria roenbergensis TaxID=33653 RepID=A0A5A8CZI6_CAFRO|nr:hypothetical protein FNF28_06254 [Cafeteria roenbergensis]KAA0159078.1 hypothetical protein FNF31_05030 [Cafeteria roenbergensis]